jgi:type I restriction enzyme S subunit
MKMRSIKRYEAYKDSGVEWLGDVPAHWQISRVKNLGLLSRGVDLARDVFKAGNYPVYGSNGIIGYHSEYTTKGPSLTVGRSGSVGEINFVQTDFWAHNTALYLQENFNNDIRFIFYRFLSLNLQSFSAGSAVGTLNRNVIHQLVTAIPPFSEQQAIAAYLDTQTAQIDRKIDLLSQKAAQYGKLKQSLINETVTRGLDKTVPMKDSGVEWIGEVPAHWEVNRIKEVCDINKSTLSEKTPASYEFNYVDIGSVTYGVKGYIKERMTFDAAPSRAKRIVQKGDTIISTVRTYLKAITSIDDEVSDLIVSTGFAVISPQRKIVDKYCSYLLTSNCIVDEICALSTGVSYPATNATVIGGLFFLIPPIVEQKTIAAYLDEKTAHIDRIVSIINSQIDKLKELRLTLINDVVTGKIKVA